MPILSENKNLYPKNWKAISIAIRKRAGDKCEFCGIKNTEQEESTQWIKKH